MTNHAPVVNAGIPNRVCYAGSIFSYTLSPAAFTDADGDALTYSSQLYDGSALPGWLTFNPATKTFSGTLTAPLASPLVIIVTATDTSLASGSTVFTLSSINRNPVAVNDNGATTEDSACTLSGTLLLANDTDADGDVLTLVSVSPTSTLGASVSLSGGSVIYTPGTQLQKLAAGITATDTFSYEIQDTSAAKSTGTVTVTVTGINDPPVAGTTISPQDIYRSTPFSYTLPTTALTDVDTGDVLTYTATQLDGTALPDWLSFDASTRTFTGVPPADIINSLSIKVTATDTSAASANTTFSFVPTDSAPVVGAGVDAQTATEHQRFTLVVDPAAFSDVDAAIGDVLSYSATQITGLVTNAALPNWLSFNASTLTFSGTPDSSAPGDYTIRLTATDSAFEFAYSDFMLSVINVNDPPTLTTPIPKQTWKALENTSYSIPANTFSDVDIPYGDTLTLSAWSSFNKPLPTWLTFDNSTNTISGTPPNSNTGISPIWIYATDQYNVGVGTFLKLNIQYANQAPVVSHAITDKLGTEGKLFSLSIPKNTFTDPDKGDILKLSLSDSPDWLSLDTRKGLLTGVPGYTSSGDYSVTIVATDKEGLTTSTTFVISVADNPVILGTSASDWLEGDSGNNTLYGKAGNDSLTGGDGADKFVFDTNLGPKNIDSILDFVPGTDQILLNKKIFSAYKVAGADLSADFIIGTMPLDSTDHFLYNPDTGELAYDPDGTGTKQAITFAVLSGIPALTSSDMLII